MENAILRDLQFDALSGRLRYKGIRYLLIRPETVVAFQKAVEDELGEGAGDLMARGGQAGGTLSTRHCREAMGLSAEETARFMVAMGGQIGWGAFALERLDLEARELIVSVRASPFADAYGPSDRPVCHLIRGVMAGLAEGLFGGPVIAREEACASQGALACRFYASACRPTPLHLDC